jgi:uncharacterized protein YegP (UPF0339 family)
VDAEQTSSRTASDVGAAAWTRAEPTPLSTKWRRRAFTFRLTERQRPIIITFQFPGPVVRATVAFRGLQRRVRRVPVPLKASNGEVIASSESYKSKASALNGIESVKKNAGGEVVDLTDKS